MEISIECKPVAGIPAAKLKRFACPPHRMVRFISISPPLVATGTTGGP
jgi:hypothetical protein